MIALAVKKIPLFQNIFLRKEGLLSDRATKISLAGERNALS